MAMALPRTGSASGARYRYLMPLADPVLGKAMAVTLFRASSREVVG